MNYEQFAYIYDELMDDAPYQKWVAYATYMAGTYGKGKKLIDIGCGTGTLAVSLAGSGFEVTGVDLSENMLAVAQQKAYDAGLSIPLFQADMSELPEIGTFDIATVFCDALNYLPSEQEVRKTFHSIRSLLHSGGLLLFDVHSLYKINKVYADQTFADDSDDLSYIWQCQQGSQEGVVEHRLSFFLQDHDGRYHRFNESHIQRTFAKELYVSWLAEAGFSVVTVTADFTKSPPDKTAERIFIAAKKEDL